jgi:uncharacterized protein (DUF486 family)
MFYLYNENHTLFRFGVDTLQGVEKKTRNLIKYSIRSKIFVVLAFYYIRTILNVCYIYRFIVIHLNTDIIFKG